MDFPPYPGIRKKGFDFLKGLAENNDREWFKARKEIYEQELQWPLRCLVVDAGRRCSSRNIPLQGDPKKSLFRIYRDTRFSKNKAPYKTHVSAVVSRSGTTKDSGVYIHVEPKNCMLASGFWRPESGQLRAFRARMGANPREFLSMARKLERKGLPLEPHDEPLKRIPRGFEDHDGTPIGEFLRWKSFIAHRKISQKDVGRPEFAKQVVDFARDVMPLLEYGWSLK